MLHQPICWVHSSECQLHLHGREATSIFVGHAPECQLHGHEASLFVSIFHRSQTALTKQNRWQDIHPVEPSALMSTVALNVPRDV
jgi:hypothetical protein